MANVTDLFYSAESAGVINGYGWQFMVGNGASPEVFESVALVSTITPGAMTTADIDRTHLRSPDAHREHAPGIRDSGPFQMTGKWAPTHQSQSNTGVGSGSGPFATGGLISFWRDREIRNCKLVANDGSPATEWPFRGYVSQFQPGQIGFDKDVDFAYAVQPSEAYDADLP